MSRPIDGYEGVIMRLRTFWLRYAHVASLQERTTDHQWSLSIRPRDSASCPFSITVSHIGVCAFEAGPIAYDDIPLEPVEHILAICAAVADGRIEQSERRCRWSGLVREREARITLTSTPERTFKGGHVNGLLALILPRGLCTQVTSGFAAYPIAEGRAASNIYPLPQQVFIGPPIYSA